MSATLGDALPAHVHARLSDADSYRERAIVICSVDDHGRPHPAMVTVRELFAVNAHTLSLTTRADSRTAANLRANGHVTIVIADHDGVYYIKGAAAPLDADPDQPALAIFTVRIVEILEDFPTAGEDARILTGIRFRRL